MRVKRAITIFVGTFQVILGLVAILLAYLMLCNPTFFPLRDMLGLREEYVSLFFLVLGIIGFFTMISGTLIIYEWSMKEEETYG